MIPGAVLGDVSPVHDPHVEFDIAGGTIASCGLAIDHGQSGETAEVRHDGRLDIEPESGSPDQRRRGPFWSRQQPVNQVKWRIEWWMVGSHRWYGDRDRFGGWEHREGGSRVSGSSRRGDQCDGAGAHEGRRRGRRPAAPRNWRRDREWKWVGRRLRSLLRSG